MSNAATNHSTETLALPVTSPGTERFLTVHRWGTAGAGKKAYVQAALHADEWPGVMAAHHLISALDTAAAEGRIVGEVVMLPYANPIGMSQTLNGHLMGRFRFGDGGGNFNRGWPDLTEAVLDRMTGTLGDDASANIPIVRGALRQAVAELPDATEREAHQKALLSLSIDADYVLDLHCDSIALLHLFANAEHEDVIMQMACDMQSPVVMLDNGLAGECFDECNALPWIKVRRALGLSPEALPAACFSTTVEFRGHCDVLDKQGARDAADLLSFLMRQGVVSGDPGPLPKAACEATPLDGCDMFTAPVGGLVAWQVPLGSQVKTGDHIADIIDITATDPATARTSIMAQQTGLLFSQHTDHLVRPGQIIGKIAGKDSLSHRQGGSLLTNR